MIYQIKVKGWLGKDWSEWFDGMTITTEKEHNDLPVTIFTGPVLDQAALRGLLNKIFNLGLFLLAVDRIRSKITHSSDRSC